MEKKRSSTTAEGMALIRAIEWSRPSDRRICFDPIASSLVNPVSVFLAKLVIDSGLYDRISTPGAAEFIVARERYIDDFLKACLAEGLEQVVILGAGFDTRAYRTSGIEKVRVFEVDHPATQSTKLKRLKKVVDPLPGNVVFIPVDLDTESLAECLLANGYDEREKTLFIWQGVTMYLTAEGIDSTLSFIATRSGPGSAVIFDYFYNETLRDMRMSSTKRITRTISESIIFGIDEGQIGSFLTSRGFRDVRNADAEELERLYMNGPNAERMIAKGAAIASARVSNAVQ
ncbi:MAG: class I SAM-dependent methyltransferase [Bacillota bacterium]